MPDAKNPDGPVEDLPIEEVDIEASDRALDDWSPEVRAEQEALMAMLPPEGDESTRGPDDGFVI